MTATASATRCATCGGSPAVRQTRLCETHYREAIQRVRDSILRKKPTQAIPGTKSATLPPFPPAVTLYPGDVFDAGERRRVPAVERARHMARFVHKIGKPVRRADAARVAGVDPLNGNAKSVLDTAERRGWIKRDERGSVLPGDVKPD